MRGTFALDRKPKTEHFANKFGAMTCAYYFWKSLTDSGWEVSGGYADIDRGGYILPAEWDPAKPAKGNIITFSIMTNNCDAPASEVREKITKIISLLAK